MKSQDNVRWDRVDGMIWTIVEQGEEFLSDSEIAFLWAFPSVARTVHRAAASLSQCRRLARFSAPVRDHEMSVRTLSDSAMQTPIRSENRNLERRVGETIDVEQHGHVLRSGRPMGATRREYVAQNA